MIHRLGRALSPLTEQVAAFTTDCQCTLAVNRAVIGGVGGGVGLKILSFGSVFGGGSGDPAMIAGTLTFVNSEFKRNAATHGGDMITLAVPCSILITIMGLWYVIRWFVCHD